MPTECYTPQILSCSSLLSYRYCPFLGYTDSDINDSKIIHVNENKTRQSNTTQFFTFMLLCIVIDCFLNNQPDALIIQNLFCYKTLHVSGILSAHHQEFSTVHSAMVSFLQVFDDRFQADSGRNCCAVPS